jgi:rod shape-determining protein MreC
MEYTPPPLFKQGPSARARLIFFVTLSVGLLVVDARYNGMEVVRKALGSALYPLQRIASAPIDLIYGGLEYATTIETLKNQNQALQKEQLQNRQKLHQLETLKAENERLRKLTGLGSVLDVKRTMMTEIVSDSNDPFSKKIVIGKGMIQSIGEGMPVIDELGLVGQVTRTFASRAEVTLITGKGYIVPVENLRSGVRSLAYGGQDDGMLELRFMPPHVDMQANDVLVTSGLDGIYPKGIPVARVKKIDRNSRYAFASILCEPIAGVERHRFVLVLDTTHNTQSTAPPLSEQPPTPEVKKNGR